MIADRVGPECRKFSFEELAVSVLEEEKCVSILVSYYLTSHFFLISQHIYLFSRIQPFSAGVALLRKYNSERRCRLTMAFESTSWRPMYLAVPKSSPYKEEINRALAQDNYIHWFRRHASNNWHFVETINQVVVVLWHWTAGTLVRRVRKTTGTVSTGLQQQRRCDQEIQR